jgi:hypothetical protein
MASPSLSRYIREPGPVYDKKGKAADNNKEEVWNYNYFPD